MPRVLTCASWQIATLGHNSEGSCICKPRPESACVVDPNCTAFGHETTVKTVAWSPNSKLILSLSNDNFVKIWDAGTGAQVQILCE